MFFMEMKKISVNSSLIKVKLNKVGEMILQSYYENNNMQFTRSGEIKKIIPSTMDDGYYIMSFRELFDIFGSYISLKNELPFESDILFYDYDIKDLNDKSQERRRG